MPPAGSERLLYVLPVDPVRSVPEPSIGAADLWAAAWRNRWIVAVVLLASVLAGAAYVLLTPKWYRAEVVLVPAQERSSQGLMARFGGLASLAGISVGGGAGAEPLAVLRSRQFSREFIEAEGLLPVLFADKWNASTGSWEDADPRKHPDLRDAVRYFDLRVRTVEDDPKSGLVTVSVEWTDSKLSADWAIRLVERLNERMRERALAEAAANISYLQGELARTDVVAMQQSIGQLLESEMQKLMLARGNKEFSFKIVDRPDPPKRHTWPRLSIVLMLAIVAGTVLSAILVAWREYRRLRLADRGHA
jgi:hypothetical protein